MPSLTPRLQNAFARAATLPAEEQDALASLVLDEIEDDTRWDVAFATSQDVLAMLAAEAAEEHRRGETKDLDPDALGRM
jgi:hypothetical protein